MSTINDSDSDGVATINDPDSDGIATINDSSSSSIYSVSSIDGRTVDQAVIDLVTLISQIYFNNPYAYTLKASRDSMKTFLDEYSYLTIKPNVGEWIIQGKGLYSNVERKYTSHFFLVLPFQQIHSVLQSV